MAKKTSKIISIIAWLVGVLVSLAVGSGMVQKVLTIPFIPVIVTQIAGWIVVVGAVVSIVMVLFDR